MRAAEKKAQETLPDFISALKRKPEGSVFSIKAGLPTSTGEIEHIWIDDPVYKDGTFTGTLGNEPIDIPGKKLGSVVRVTRDKVEDWIIMEGENMRGGYTVDVIAKRLQENGK